MSRWFGVGHATDTDAHTAGREAAGRSLTGPDPVLLVVFASEGYDFEALLRGVQEAAGRVPMIGCSTAGEISGLGASDHGVVVNAFGGDFEVAVIGAREASFDLEAAGSTVAGAVRALGDAPHTALMLLSDGLAGDQTEVVRGAYKVLGAAVPLVGGCAGDDLQMRRTHQFLDGEVLTDAVVAAAIGSDAPIGIGVAHGWRRVGEQMLVTSSGDRRIFTLNDRPALDVYLEALDAPEAVRTDPAAFTRYAMTHPLGLQRRLGTEIRFVGEADMRTRALVCIAQVPEGELVWFMEGDDDTVLDATDQACRVAVEQLGEHAPVGVLAFDCIARRGVLGDDGLGREIDRIRRNLPDVPVGGFYTYGEFARTQGVRGFHNQTLVVLAVA